MNLNPCEGIGFNEQSQGVKENSSVNALYTLMMIETRKYDAFVDIPAAIQ